MNESLADETAQNILKLIGSQNQLNIMIGAKDFFKGMYGEKQNYPGIQFKFKLCKKYNFCQIYLNQLDLYNLELGKIKKFEYADKIVFENIYFDNLGSIFSEKTGLALRPPVITTINRETKYA